MSTTSASVGIAWDGGHVVGLAEVGDHPHRGPDRPGRRTVERETVAQGVLELVEQLDPRVRPSALAAASTCAADSGDSEIVTVRGSTLAPLQQSLLLVDAPYRMASRAARQDVWCTSWSRWTGVGMPSARALSCSAR